MVIASSISKNVPPNSLETQLPVNNNTVASVDALTAVRISEAIKNDDLITIRKSLPSVSTYRSQFGTVLHLAASFGSTKTFDELLSEGIDVNCQNIDGCTALHVASRLGRQEIVELLLCQEEIDDTIKDKEGKSPLEIAKSRQISSVFEYARNIYVIKKTKQMITFALRGDFDSLKELFEKPRNQALLDINTIDHNGDTILHICSRMGNLQMVQLVLNLGADPFIKNRKGKIPMEVCKDEMIKHLLKEAPMVNSHETILGHRTRVEGFLGKWTNYAEGYRRRWFVLEDGILSYYKSQVDYPVSCRGSLNLQFAQVFPHSHDRLRFEVNGMNSTMRYHLRADNAADAKRWIIAINQAQVAMSTEPSPSSSKIIPIVGAGTGSPDSIYHNLIDEEFEKTGKNLINTGLSTLESFELLFARIFVEEESAVNRQEIEEEARNSFPTFVKTLKQILTEFEERESVWKQKLESETQQRQLFEDSLRAVALENHKLELYTRKKLKNSPSNDIKEIEEFYDAVESEDDINISDESDLSTPSDDLVSSSESLRKLRISSMDFIEAELVGYPENFRTSLPADSTGMPAINLWSILKGMLGKDLFRVPLPVNFSEPLSMLQRLCEEMEYSELLDQAARSGDPSERIMLVGLFAISGYSSTDCRLTKPFNPLLGETFEYVSREKGFRYMSEQVSHHPPISACHCESANWILWSDANVKNKFSGRCLELIPEGYTHIVLKTTGDHYIFRKVKSAVYNIIVGKLWLDHYGTMKIENVKNKSLYCQIEFKPAGWTDSKKVHLKVLHEGIETLEMEGKWNHHMGQIWHKTHMPPNSAVMYKFTTFAMSMNQLTETLKKSICPTDSRLRPDQRAMETGYFEEANNLKIKLEEKQRTTQKLFQESQFEYTPRWFIKTMDEVYKIESWKFTDEYWQIRKTGEWKNIPDIF
jgi:oxysterol-binding protein 1